MFESTKALREQRAKHVADARKILDEAEKRPEGQRDLTAEERERWDKAHADERSLKAKIDVLETQERAEAEMKAPVAGIGREATDGKDDRALKPAVSLEDRALAFQGWIRFQCRQGVEDRHEEAAKRVGFNLRQKELSIRVNKRYKDVRNACRLQRSRERGLILPEARTSTPLSAFIGAVGAYTIPEGFVSNLETALLAFAQMRDVADVMRTESGNDLPWPTAIDTTNKGHMIAENTAVATNTPPAFGQIVFRAYKWTSDFVLVPTELIEDSAFNLEEWLGMSLGTRLGRMQADKFTTGSGAGEPTGIVTAATSGVTAASQTAIAADEIYGLKHSVDPAYRADAGWMFHDNILLAIKKLKDGFGRYLFQASLAGGAPDTLDDDPITINQSMASSIATTAKTMLYGALGKYKIREVNEYRMYHLVERYRDSDQDAFGMFARFDGNLLDAGTHPVKYLAQA